MVDKSDRIDVSIIIPCYNACGTLMRAVKSALNQTGVAVECLIVDDASEDDTLALAHALAADSRVRVFALPKNGGPSAARNFGFQHARGDWLAILDADDAFLPTRLRTLIDAAIAGRAEAAYDNLLILSSDGQYTLGYAFAHLRTKPAPMRLLDFLELAIPMRHRKGIGYMKPIISREFIEKNNLRYNCEYRVGEDFEFYLRLIRAGGRLIGIRAGLYAYTLSEMSLTRSGEWTYPVLISMCEEVAHRLPQRSTEQKAVLHMIRKYRRIDSVLRGIRLLRQRKIVSFTNMIIHDPRIAIFAVTYLTGSLWKRIALYYSRRPNNAGAF